MKIKIYSKLKTGMALLLLVSLISGCNLMDGNSRTGNYSIQGVVKDKAGNPVEGVEISADGVSSSVMTASDGSYELEGLGKKSTGIKARKSGYVFIPEFSALKGLSDSYSGNIINIGMASTSGKVHDVNFTAVEGGILTVSDIQGDSLESPMKGMEVSGITGVVTMVCRRAPHFKYDTVDYDGETVPQWLSYDGFFLEALPEDKDVSGKKSNGIFINTHDDSFEATDESHWKSGIPTDLQAGDVVVINGKVEETRHIDRFGSASGVLTRTEINAGSVMRKVSSSGSYVTAPYPDGVLLTYSESYAEKWLSEDSTKGYREARVLPFDLDTAAPLKDAINVMESVESMVIRIDNPLVVGATYYNLTGVLADGGKKGIDSSSEPGSVTGGTYPRTFNEKWQGDVIWENRNGIQDFNEELIFVDYQAVDWTTFYPITQMGDYLVDSTGARVFRGVMDYTVDGLYMAHPLNSAPSNYVVSSGNASISVTPYYTRTDVSAVTSVTGRSIPDQKWNFDTADSWYYQAAGETVAKAMTGGGIATSKSVQPNSVTSWRLGTTSNSSFNASELFTPAWKDESSPSGGNRNLNSLTVAAFNIENYETQGNSNSKQENVALVIKNNLLYPDVLFVVEMGDDSATTVYYDNQDNSWAEKDGNVTAVRNFSGIIDVIKNAQKGPQYDFLCIDPHEQDSGGKPGVNIRVGIMYNTNRVVPRFNGLVANDYFNTHGGRLDADGNRDYSTCTALLDEKKWPVQTKDHHAQGWALADAVTGIFKDDKGVPHLSQNPSYIHSEYFKGSRRPIAAEFLVKDRDGKPTDQNFFAIGCHLGSKRGDFPLYGSIQPPLLLSEVKRNGQARTVYDFVNTIVSADPEAKVVVGGDMNDFAYSTPQRILKGELGCQIMWSIVEETMPYVEQFSYTFHGNLQEIDHIFVSKALKDKVSSYILTEAEKENKDSEGWKNVCMIPHINSMFTRNNHVNLSDHDPDIIRIPDVFNVSE